MVRKVWAELRLAKPLAGPGRAALGQQDARGIGIAGQALGGARPVEGDAVMHHEAFLGIADGRLQQLVEPAGAVVGGDPRPGIDETGDGDGMGRRRSESR